MNNNKVRDVVIGLAVGDALGVPVEFTDRDYLLKNPVTDMREYGTWNQPKGTWSDDSSMAFALMEGLIGEFSLNKIADNFVKWAMDSWWTPHGTVFDIGGSTSRAIAKLVNGTSPLMSGGTSPDTNGNGSLMRTAPLVFSISGMYIDDSLDRIEKVSAITHAHPISTMSCFYYVTFLSLIIDGFSVKEVYDLMQLVMKKALSKFHPEISDKFDRLVKANIQDLSEKEIGSDGYVLNTLEASIWCILNTTSYKGAVLKAVNLGDDTDTTGAVTGALAGALYGYDNIPIEWVNVLARRNDIFNLIKRFKPL